MTRAGLPVVFFASVPAAISRAIVSIAVSLAAAMAVEVKDVDNSIVIAGGVTTANLPQVARTCRRSASEAGSFFESSISRGAWNFPFQLEGTNQVTGSDNK
jgi:hypothetical protein